MHRFVTAYPTCVCFLVCPVAYLYIRCIYLQLIRATCSHIDVKFVHVPKPPDMLNLHFLDVARFDFDHGSGEMLCEKFKV